MSSARRVTLEQWRALVTVVETGGYEAAAEALSKSQSSVTYAIKQLETALGVQVFQREGRRSVLSPTGRLLHRHARELLRDAEQLERIAGRVSAGWEPVIGVSADVIFPVWLLLRCFDQFSGESPHTHIEFIESVMGGTQEDLLTGRADLAISHAVPTGFLGEPLLTLRFVPVAHPDHSLHQAGRPLRAADLARHRHLLVRESDSRRASNTSVAAQQRWTVSNMSTSIGAACRGYGFAWYPEHKIRNELAQEVLKPLPMENGAGRLVTVYLIIADAQSAGPGVRRLADIIRANSNRLGVTTGSAPGN